MTKMHRMRLLLTIIGVVLGLIGCSKDHLDPTQIGRFRPAPAVSVILDSLGVAEESAPAYEGAEDPRPVDVIAYEEDYTFSSGDTIRISIFELLQEGRPYVDDFVVSESGNISIPEIGQIQVAGLTEVQLEEEIRNSLSPGVLKNPSVTITLMSSMSKAFTVVGDGIAYPGRYQIPRCDFRLLDALATAGSARQFNVSYIYVARRLTGREQIGGQFIREGAMDLESAEEPVNLKSVEPERQSDVNNVEKSVNPPQDIIDDDLLQIIEPTFSKTSSEELVIASAEMLTEDELEILALPEGVNGNSNEVDNAKHKASSTMPEVQQEQGRIEWIFRDGKWIPVQVKDVTAVESQKQIGLKPALKSELEEKGLPPTKREEVVPIEPETKSLPEHYGWEDIQSAGIQSRVIRIPKDKLYGGDPRYNIIIKPQDTITAQLDVVGEFYVLGNVNNQGVVNLTGRPMTLKMAIAAAGGLGPLAWPRKCEVIRRIGEKKEEIVMVDLEKIANGTQPDFFVKPNDVINVGTHGISRWLAVLRNAFRASYGVGFVYDRNFADKQFREIVEDSLSIGLP
jgi:protein involved in polysaccharide export with SLBB domain